MDDIRWDHPKPFSVAYTYPDCHGSSSLSHYYFNPVIGVNPFSTMVVNIKSDGFNLNGCSVFDWKWSLASRALKRAVDMPNCHANRQRVRVLIRNMMKRFNLVDSPLLDVFDRMTMKLLIRHYSSVLLLQGTNCAKKMQKLHPCFEVTPTFVTRDNVTLIHYIIIPYRFQSEPVISGPAGNVYISSTGVMCGSVTGHLHNGFREFVGFGEQTPIRVHRAQLETSGLGQCFLARSLHEAAIYQMQKQVSVVANTVTRVARRDMYNRSTGSSLTPSSPRDDEPGPDIGDGGGDGDDDEQGHRDDAHSPYTSEMHDVWSFI